MSRPRFVFDTNTLVAASLIEGSTPDQALRRALAIGDILLSAETLFEAADVLRRSKFDDYISVALREEFLEAFVDRALWLEPTAEVRACRDPKDDKFLDLAITGNAEVIVTGDSDLLTLHPFRGVSILRPSSFLVAYREAK